MIQIHRAGLNESPGSHPNIQPSLCQEPKAFYVDNDFHRGTSTYPVVVAAVGVDRGAACGALLAFYPGFFSWSGLAVCLLLHWLTGGIGICLTYHRLLTHRSFALRPYWLEYVLTAVGTLASEGGPVGWVADHRKHHAHSDDEQDTHTPLRGFFWAHMYWWMLVGDETEHTPEFYEKWAPDLYRDPVHRWLDFGVGADIFQTNSARAFQGNTAFKLGATFDRAPHVFGRHVIEQDGLRAMGQRVVKFLWRADFYLDGLGAAAVADCVLQGGDNSAGERDVIVLDEDSIGKIEAVILAAAATHSVFVDHAQTGSGLASVENTRFGAGDGVDELASESGDAGSCAAESSR